ncbi:MAG: hypothetical protein HRT44_06675, partial [Bdellovibrionales bacterium]|nr:hypothetical protein [Bdellovibrionales bacterium]NQZ18924.1 hypothetical protein [Bdellovibrionales bacterium]
LGTHRSDGYWHINHSDSSEVISLEVEISPKKISRYTKVKDFYDYHQEVSNVIWVTENLPMAKRILSYLTKGGFETNKKHNFLLQKDILKKNWDSPIILGPNKGSTLNEFMGQRGVRKPVERRLAPTSHLLVDTNLYSVSSDT